MMPRSGGYYVFARRALGDFPAFVVGWTDWLATVRDHRRRLDPGGGVRRRSVPAAGRAAGGAGAGDGGGAGAAAGARGIRWGALVQGVTSAAKGLALLGLVAAFLLLAAARRPRATAGAGCRVAALAPLAARCWWRCRR